MFHLFNALPWDLKVQIWDLVFFQPTIWAIIKTKNSFRSSFYGPDPSIMGMVCREWREEMKRKCTAVRRRVKKRRVDKFRRRRTTWLMLDRTTIYVDSGTDNQGWFESVSCFPPQFARLFEQIEGDWRESDDDEASLNEARLKYPPKRHVFLMRWDPNITDDHIRSKKLAPLFQRPRPSIIFDGF